MEFGIATFVTDEGVTPTHLGRALEQRGFESLFIAEHSHIPVNRESQPPDGGELPRKYYRTLDPFVTLTAVAVVTVLAARSILLERGLIGQQASGVNFGNVRRQGRYLHQLPLANRSRAIWES